MNKLVATINIKQTETLTQTAKLTAKTERQTG